MSDPITYKELKISTFEIQYIKELKITADINEHTNLTLVAVLPEDREEKDINTKCNTPIKVYVLRDNESTDLYYGIITEIKVKRNADYFELHVKAKSYTYLMDIIRRKRSFQNRDLSIYNLVQGITKVYYQGVCNLNISDERVNKLWLQYDETDFEFIKRIASYYNVGIFPGTSTEGVHYYIGTPQQYPRSIEAYEYTVTKLIEDYNNIQQNDLPDSNDNLYINYQVKSYEIFELGSCVNFKGQFLYVSKLVYEIRKGILTNIYNLQPQEAQNKGRIYGEKFRGISLEGTVSEVSSDQIKVKLDIDNNNQDCGYCWFKYSTVAASSDGSGWYFMPEVNDRVRIYFPTADEEDAFAISCIHEINADPSTKYISTIHGNKIVFSNSGITISAGGNSTIYLDKGGGISISGGSISVNASDSVSISSGNNVVISGRDNVEISCDKGGKVTLDGGGNVVLKGTKVKIN